MDLLKGITILEGITIKEIVLGTITTIIVSIITYIITVIYKFRFPSLGRLVFWNSFLKDLVLVPSEITLEHDPVSRHGKQFSMIPTAEVLAMINIASHLRTEYNYEPQVLFAQHQSDFDNLKEKNLLIIGGPKYNVASFEYLREMDEKLFYQFKRLRQKTAVNASDIEYKAFVNKAGQDAFSYDPTKNNHYGTVIISNNPFNPKKKIVLIGGLLQISTLGASEWFIRMSTKTILLNLFFGNGFQAIINCKENDHAKIRDFKLVELNKFDS